MSRVSPAPSEIYEPLFGAQAPLRVQIYAQRPEIAAKFVEFGQLMRDEHILPARLLELVRLRVAFHNQCRSCMSVRYSYGVEDGLTEGLVCSLEQPEEAEDLTDAERAAIAYADLMATNHFGVDDQTFARLREHFSEPEIMELCFTVGISNAVNRFHATFHTPLDDRTRDALGATSPLRLPAQPGPDPRE